MNNHPIFDFVQKGFRVTIGATTVLLETLQDTHKRQETFSQLQTQWNELAHEWAKKGEQTEEEARQIINKIWNQKQNTSRGDKQTVTTVDVSSTTSEPVESDIKNLTQQLIELRQQLEDLRQNQ